MQRHFNWQGSQRVDVPHLRAVESAVTADFQLLAGQVLAGGAPLVVKGFTIPVNGAVGNPASNLTLLTAGGVLVHPLAAESGALFSVPASQAAETLNGANAKVVGSFVAGTNYVGIDLVRVKDSGTADSVSFLSDATKNEFTQTKPLGRSLQYRVYIQTVDFDHATNVLPLAVVVVDANGNVTSITDARQMAFRLGKGGTSPAQRTPYATMANRAEPGIIADSGHAIDPFTGGEKSFGSLRDWMSAVMTRIWEIGGGSFWYSPAVDRTVKLVLDPAKKFAQTSENWYWTGTNLRWQGVQFIFTDGAAGGWQNKVVDQTVDQAGLTDLQNGECIYIDLDRTSNNFAIAAHKAQYANAAFATWTVPGSRRILAWRDFNSVYVDGQSTPANTGSPHATISSFGSCEIYRQPADQTDSIVPAVDGSGRVSATGLTNPGVALAPLNVGNGAYDSVVNIGGGANNAAVSVGKDLSVTGLLNVFDTVDASGARVLKIGPTLATEVDIGKVAVPTKVLDLLYVTAGATKGIDTPAAGALYIGAANANEVDISKVGIVTKVLGALNVAGAADFFGAVNLHAQNLSAVGALAAASAAVTGALSAAGITGTSFTQSGGAGGTDGTILSPDWAMFWCAGGDAVGHTGGTSTADTTSWNQYVGTFAVDYSKAGTSMSVSAGYPHVSVAGTYEVSYEWVPISNEFAVPAKFEFGLYSNPAVTTPRLNVLLPGLDLTSLVYGAGRYPTVPYRAIVTTTGAVDFKPQIKCVDANGGALSGTTRVYGGVRMSIKRIA